MKKLIAIVLAVTVMTSLGGVALANGDGSILLSAHTYTWTDPASGGMIQITENVYEKANNDMMWEYVVENLTYDPDPPYTNGLSGFQIIFPNPVPELYNQQSPSIGGPWQQNAYSGQFPPFGVEWDTPLPGVGIMPGETGVFSFDTFERVDVMQDDPDSWAHTWGLPIPEPIIDLDGADSPGPGGAASQDVAVLDPIRGWPTGFWQEGIDWFDNDNDFAWSFGVDDIHVEDPTTHAGAIRNAIHDATDPMVIDNSGLAPGTPVDVDLESGSDWHGGTGPDPMMKFFDANVNNFWDNREDIVLDVNLDGIFGSVANTQTYIFYGRHSVPGELYNLLGTESSAGLEISKIVKYIDDGDGLIEVGEVVNFLQIIQVHNSSGGLWTDVVVKDNFGAELDVEIADVSSGMGAVLSLKGNSDKEKLMWEIGDLADGATVNLVMTVVTDITPGGDQSYTDPCWHEFNSGATLKVRVDGKQRSYETDSIMVSVLTVDGLGDADGDGIIDIDEIAAGTDPHNPESFPNG